MEEAELEPELAAVRREAAALGDGSPGRAWELHLRAAWLLIALHRPDEAPPAAARAQRSWARARGAAGTGHGGGVLWEACAAEAVAHLAVGRPEAAEASARQALADFEEEESNAYLLELALQAQGRLHPERFRRVTQDPARELAEFDAARFARTRLR